MSRSLVESAVNFLHKLEHFLVALKIRIAWKSKNTVKSHLSYHAYQKKDALLNGSCSHKDSEKLIKILDHFKAL